MSYYWELCNNWTWQKNWGWAVMLCFYKSVLLRSLELHLSWKCFLSLQGTGIVSKINVRWNNCEWHSLWDKSLCLYSFSFLVTDFSQWVYILSFEMEQSLCVVFRLQGNVIICWSQLACRQNNCMQEVVLGFSRARLSATQQMTLKNCFRVEQTLLLSMLQLVMVSFHLPCQICC